MFIGSFSPFGYEGALVTVEVDLRRGIPAIDVVGLADSSVKEARERMRAAIRNSGFDFPPERILISLSPADVKKEGAGFDLAIALAVLEAQDRGMGDSPETQSGLCGDSLLPGSGLRDPLLRDLPGENGVLVMGELELSGKVRAVRGVHAAVSTARENGFAWCIVPRENASEAQSVTGMRVFPADTLADAREAWLAIQQLGGGAETSGAEGSSGAKKHAAWTGGEPVEFAPVTEDMEFGTVLGQEKLVRALQIAAAGGHNLMVFGPPGCGKTLALRRFPALLPQLTEEEQREVTRIYSIAGILPPNTPLITESPFRSPHQSSSLEGMCGGGAHCKPGEISLAHNGVLFLDEAAEFRTSVLQTLRVPLEQGCITLSRAGRHTTFPARFQLLIATNPCPCGNFGSRDKICVCSARAVEQYWKKFSGPLLDRVDIRVGVRQESGAMTATEQKRVTTAELRGPIARAVAIQRERQQKLNGRLTAQEVEYYCKLNDGCRVLLDKAVQNEQLSSRAVHSIIRLARTIADMEGVYAIREADVAEAVELRKSDGALGV